MKIKVRWNPKNKFCVARVHYSVDPDKNEEWVKKAREGYPTRSWDREMEIRYDIFEGKPVFEDFTEDHIQEFEYDRAKTEFVMRGWDFGYHHPFAVFAFMNQYDQLCVRSEIMGENEYIKEFGTRVRNFSISKFVGAKWLDACDDAGKMKKSTPQTDIKVLNSLDINPIYRHSFINEGLEIIRQRLVRRNDGKYGIIFHPDCKIIIGAMKGGYRYGEKKEGTDKKEEPLKDGFYDHGIDALRELCINFLDVAPVRGKSAFSGSSNNIMRLPQESINDYF